MNRIETREQLDTLREKLLKEEKKRKIILPTGTCGIAKGAERVNNSLLKLSGDLNGDFEFKITGCIGFCEVEPLVVILPEKTTYVKVKETDAREIIDALKSDRTVERLLYQDPVTEEKFSTLDEIPFYRKQMQLVFGKNLEINPREITDYITQGGYSGLCAVLGDLSQEEVIDIIKKSGLRGRGGGGFPTGKKWETCREAQGDEKYVICNADEGDPGAYMDRAVLEGNPHSVIEGMVIGAYAIGAHEGYIYVREEYPLAVQLFSRALMQAREYGFLGENIFNSGYRFDITVSRGGGAFVCGESTALMASIEGKPGEPRAKHVHTVEKGLRERPTTLNNVETWANIPLIIEKGWEWYAGIGTEKSKGTKIFSLVGKVNNTGLVEVPMGMTLREIVYDIGGGIRNGKKLKAVQTGGPSGGCVPVELIDTPVDFDRLTEVGSMMGSGGMIVMDEENCMVDIARYFIGFLRDESCGKCTPCREGLWQMYEILSEICEGKGKEEDLQILEDIAWTMERSCLCQLGTTAANPLLTTLKYFKDEYDAHIRDKRCPAGVCRSLITYSIDSDACTGCGLCRIKCSVDAVSGEKNEKHVIDPEKCIKCGICYEVCTFDAVRRD
jgi:NADH:ubiquinone oxidoreductase subunit F (NADH-binding)/(2Fe-2S) ferredoxin/Pyruvate/2-oxoacid:ferredoxin oxidoreductase delta subunit